MIMYAHITTYIVAYTYTQYTDRYRLAGSHLIFNPYNGVRITPLRNTYVLLVWGTNLQSPTSLAAHRLALRLGQRLRGALRQIQRRAPAPGPQKQLTAAP